MHSSLQKGTFPGQNSIFIAMPYFRIICNKPVLFSILLIAFAACGQPTMEKTLQRYNKASVPYIVPENVSGSEDLVLLDTRRKEEFEVSHLPNATWVGYRSFSLENIEQAYPNKKTPFVVYCSVGVRSEDIGEKLIEAGYTDVKNLYGGIFEWKNQGYPVYDMEGGQTEQVHAYNRRWGRLLKNAEKIY